MVRAAIPCAVVLWVHFARAADCAPPEVLDAFPDDGATNVPTNAMLFSHYAPSAEWVGGNDEVVTLHGPDPGGHDIPVDPLDVCPGETTDGGAAAPFPPGNYCFSKNEGLMKLMPPEDLEPTKAYTITWPGLRGLTASRSAGKKVTFTVGSGPDEQPPSFRGLEKIEWDVGRSKDDCTGDEADRFVYDLTPGRASDDFGNESLALIVFQSLGPDVSATAPPKPIALTTLPDSGKSIRVERSLDDGAGSVCFAALVRDLAGHDSGGADKQVCATTTKPPFFYGCSTRPFREPPPSSLSPFILLLSLARLRRHRCFP